MLRAFLLGCLVLLAAPPAEAQLQVVAQQVPGLAGIGAVLVTHNGAPVINEVLAHSPAAAAGLKPQDTIVWVDYRDVANMKLDEVVGLIRGETGTSVVVTVMRPGDPKPHTFTITRAPIRIQP